MIRLRGWFAGSIMRKSLAVVALPLLLLGVSVLAIYRLEQQTARAEDDVRQTLQLLSDLHEAHSLLAETAGAVRGYRLVGMDNFLDPYRLAEPSLMAVVDRVGANLTDPGQRRRFAQVRPLFVEKMQGWRELLDPTLPPDAVRDQLIVGKAKLDILRAELRAMRRFEVSELQQRVDVAQRLRWRNLVVTMIASLLAGLGAVASVGWFAAGLARRARRLATQAGLLGAGQPLALTDTGSDELGQVGESLVQASRLLAERDAETRRAREEAEAANRAKTDFLSRSSHELRTPLNAILGYAQVLELDLRDAEQRGHAQRIVSAGRHLLGLIGELLDIARIEAGRLDLALAPVSVQAVIEEALTLVRPHAGERGVGLAVAPVAPALAVHADAQRLRQVLVNLLSNAIKFNRERGEVRIEAACRESRDGGHRVRIGVIDDGPGVPPAQRERLFAPFERLGAERSAVEGTGLGLAVSKRLAEAMGGEIGLDSAPGRGAHFWIELPAATGVRGEMPTDPARATAGQAQPRALLSVEDNPSNQALIETLLARRPQWRLAHAESLHAARTQLTHSVPDLVLLDLHLPDGRGESLIAQLRNDPRLAAVPVVAVTADATAATLEAAHDAGAAAVLTKPLDVSAFFSTLDRLLA